jgi:ABC-type nitrate/sulfonate/bicarbonate transport system substrate-binding protein
MINCGRSNRHRKWFVSLAMAVFFLSAPAAAQIKSNFASSITSESMTPMWVARERGLFKKHGLDMQYVVIPRSPLAVAALVAGEIGNYRSGPPDQLGQHRFRPHRHRQFFSET